MTDREGDVLNQAIDELRVLPPLDGRRVSRIVAAAVAGRASAVDDTTAPYLPPVRRQLWRWSTVIGVAAAAGIIGFVARGLIGGASHPSAQAGQAGRATIASAFDHSAVTAGAATVISAASASSADLLPVATQFVYTNTRARAVRVIGDFNGWGSAPTPMARGADGVWSLIQPIAPGRHLYAFVVDDSVVLDPHAAAAEDPDYGVRRSVVIVGKP
jgi:hypothetical protein